MKDSKLKRDIKALAEEQLTLKPQRKTINFEGTRTVDSSLAVQKSSDNKMKLRHMYVAYNILRGREVVKFTKREFVQALVDKYVKEYKDDFIPKEAE